MRDDSHTPTFSSVDSDAHAGAWASGCEDGGGQEGVLCTRSLYIYCERGKQYEVQDYKYKYCTLPVPEQYPIHFLFEITSYVGVWVCLRVGIKQWGLGGGWEVGLRGSRLWDTRLPR